MSYAWHKLPRKFLPEKKSCLVTKAKKSKSCIMKIFANIFVYIIILPSGNGDFAT